MDALVQGALAGIIAGVLAPALLKGIEHLHHKVLVRADIRCIRAIIEEGHKRVTEAKDVLLDKSENPLPADSMRCHLYNLMIRKLKVVLDPTSTTLPATQRSQLYEALDWFHKELLYFRREILGVESYEPPDGFWHDTNMTLEQACEIFDRVAALSWLKAKVSTTQ